jgi:hypothetical protein
MRLLMTLVLVVLSCNACTQTTGRQFAKPDPARLILGTTTRADIIGLYGQPEIEKSSVVSGEDAAAKPARSEFDPAPVAGTFSYLTYHNSERLDPLLGGGLSIKIATFVCWNQSLASYDFLSSFSKESSNSDETRIGAIRKGKATRAEVEQIMGSPSGEAVYPATLTAGTRKAIYDFATVDMSSEKVASKRLIVLYGPDSHVIDYRFDSGSDDLSRHPR